MQILITIIFVYFCFIVSVAVTIWLIREFVRFFRDISKKKGE